VDFYAAVSQDPLLSMISIRKWLYKPRRDDKSLFAKFWYADDNLNRVAAELDSFDGRKDPERCATLVSRLRSCQDKLLNICNRMLDELEGVEGRANREFRVKFPDEIVTENLGGQLWFGAECLAAGSSIMQKEFESVQMRPLAKAVTKTLEKVRSLIREQCLSPLPQYTEQIHETLKIFDRMFAEFEFSYVSCMVHVKTIKEYEIHQDVICLFSETLGRAVKNQLISQENIDLFDPSLMFAIPRLAIVAGLLIYPNGPLNVDRDYTDFPELFRPFKNLLRKIRELLWTLTPAEFQVLERLLCQLEEPDDLERKLQAAQLEIDEKTRNEESQENQKSQAAKLDAKLSSLAHIPCNCDSKHTSPTSTDSKHTSPTSTDSKHTSPTSTASPTAGATKPQPSSSNLTDFCDTVTTQLTFNDSSGSSSDLCHVTSNDRPAVTPTESLTSPSDLLQSESLSCCSESHAIVTDIINDILSLTVSTNTTTTINGDFDETSDKRADDAVNAPDLTENAASSDNSISGSDVGVSVSGAAVVVPAAEQSNNENTRTEARQAVVEIDCSGPDVTVSPVKERKESTTHHGKERRERGLKSVESSRKGLKRRGAKRYHKTWKDARARFKSSEDLIHRLYVCISGAADQLQTNFAGDFRHILKYVFILNSTPDDEDEECEEEREQQEDNAEEEDREEVSESTDSEQESLGSPEEVPPTTAAAAGGVNIGEFTSPAARSSTGYECGEDALMQETEQSFLRNFGSTPEGVSSELLSTSPPALASMPVYASNLDQHTHRALLTESNPGGNGEQFYQPEPTLLTIASGAPPQEEVEEWRRRGVEAPPAWIPDAMAPLCMGCGSSFSLVRRRHHCRSCGRVFCQRCSPNQVPLPRYGMEKPVRVCNRCYIYYMNPYEERTVHAYHVYNGTGHGSWGYSSLVS